MACFMMAPTLFTALTLTVPHHPAAQTPSAFSVPAQSKTTHLPAAAG